MGPPKKWSLFFMAIYELSDDDFILDLKSVLSDDSEITNLITGENCHSILYTRKDGTRELEIVNCELSELKCILS